jgi:hypothetical protein
MCYGRSRLAATLPARLTSSISLVSRWRHGEQAETEGFPRSDAPIQSRSETGQIGDEQLALEEDGGESPRGVA